MIKTIFRSFNKGGLLKHSSILFAGTMGVHVLNVLFQMFMGRYLRPEEYALLAALLGVFNVLSTPLSVIVSTFNRYSSLLVQQNRAGDVLRLGLRWGIRLAIIGAIPSLLCFIMPQYIADFFHLERGEPVYIFGVILGPRFDWALALVWCFWCLRLPAGGCWDMALDSTARFWSVVFLFFPAGIRRRRPKNPFPESKGSFLAVSLCCLAPRYL